MPRDYFAELYGDIDDDDRHTVPDGGHVRVPPMFMDSALVKDGLGGGY
jgi:hypothetical protein